jgi:hypothetical protein
MAVADDLRDLTREHLHLLHGCKKRPFGVFSFVMETVNERFIALL